MNIPPTKQQKIESLMEKLHKELDVLTLELDEKIKNIKILVKEVEKLL